MNKGTFGTLFFILTIILGFFLGNALYDNGITLTKMIGYWKDLKPYIFGVIALIGVIGISLRIYQTDNIFKIRGELLSFSIFIIILTGVFIFL